MLLKMLSAKWQPFCLGLNLLIWAAAHSSLKMDNSGTKVSCNTKTPLISPSTPKDSNTARKDPYTAQSEISYIIEVL